MFWLDTIGQFRPVLELGTVLNHPLSFAQISPFFASDLEVIGLDLSCSVFKELAARRRLPPLP
jgi:hypothetical protein